MQAAALHDICQMRGGFLPIGVGQGKSFISLLAPVLLEAERPMLLVPAQLRDQTKKSVIPSMRKDWTLSKSLRVVGYEELSLSKNAELLERYQPDMIIADECHALKNLRSGRTRRVARWMRKNPYTVFVGMSGTITRKSILDYWHLVLWALKENDAPLPITWREINNWALALDEGVDPRQRMKPGALMSMCRDGENARQGYARRLVETPGVVATSSDTLDVSLRLYKRKITVPSEVRKAMDTLQKHWRLPDGDDITEAVDLWRHMRTISCGYWNVWDPKPPRQWLEARAAWKKYARQVLLNNRRGLDTEKQVALEAKRDGNRTYFNWLAVKETYKPTKKAVWISDYVVQHALKWMDANKKQGIVWTPHIPFGQKMREHGVPYYGAGDERIRTAKGACVASIGAHSTGKNLQTLHSRNLVICPPSSGDTWEQMLGRTHRTGQPEEEVTFEIMMQTAALSSAMMDAFSDAIYLRDSTQNPQRLLYADKDFPVNDGGN